MTFRLDVREVNASAKAEADEIVFLKVPNPASPHHHFSYDAEVVTKAGEVWKMEIKWGPEDAVSSWLDREPDGHSRLGRQMSYTDALLVVWNDFDVELTFPAERLPAAKAVKTWLAKKALMGKPVIFFGSPEELLKFIRHLESQKEPLRCPQTSLIAPST